MNLIGVNSVEQLFLSAGNSYTLFQICKVRIRSQNIELGFDRQVRHLLIALCLMAVPNIVQNVRAASYVETALTNHNRYLHGELSPGIRTKSPEPVTAWFADKVPFQFRLPSSEAALQANPTYELAALVKPGSLATINALDQLRKEPELKWSFLSPSAELKPGQRTGKFRLGNDQLLIDATGQSKISVQDYAVAMIDELERPTHVRRRFTVEY